MTQPERFHAFDGLRAWMMLLGVVLHSGAAYSTLEDVWWLKDPRTSPWMDALLLFIHTFRLPVFFVMAGFFSAMLVARRGAWSFLENRMSRLGLPFLLGMLAVFPVLKISSVWAHFAFRRPDPDPLGRVLGWLAEGRLGRSLEPAHFWFLEVLLWTCVAATAAAPWLDRLRTGWFRRLLQSGWGLPLLAAATAAPLALMPLGVLETPHGFAPVPAVQAAYALFYCFGWGVYRNRELLPVLRRHGWGKIALAPVAACAAYGLVRAQLAQPQMTGAAMRLGSAGLNALAAWLMILGLMGLFLRYGSQPGARMRYLSDSAYWMYMVHPVVLVAVQIPMMYLPWPVAVKFIAGAAAAFPVLLWTYDRWVRATWVGLALNGKRQARWSDADADLAVGRDQVVDAPRERDAVHQVQAPFLPAAEETQA